MFLEMLSTACGPTFTLNAGRLYSGVPAEIRKSLCSTTTQTVRDIAIVNGKEVSADKVIGTTGPYAREVKDPGKRQVFPFQRRNPNKTETLDDDE